MRFNSLHQKNTVKKPKIPRFHGVEGATLRWCPLELILLAGEETRYWRTNLVMNRKKMVQEDKHSYSVFRICYLFSWRVFYPHVCFSALQLRLPSFLSRSELFPILQKNPSGPTFTFQTQNLHIPNLKVKKIKTLHKYKYYCFLRRIGIFF